MHHVISNDKFHKTVFFYLFIFPYFCSKGTAYQLIFKLISSTILIQRNIERLWEMVFGVCTLCLNGFQVCIESIGYNQKLMKQNQGENFKLVTLKELDYDKLLLEVETTFWKDELVCAYLDLTPDDLYPLFHPVIGKAYEYDFSLAYVNEKGEAVSVVTNMPYGDYLKLKVPEKCPQKTDALVEILGAVDEGYRAEDLDNTVLSFTWSTRADYARRGLFCDLFDKSMERAKAQGFKMVMADCMNIKSQGAAKKMGFVSKAEVFYKPYVLNNGSRPFDGLPENESVVRMIKEL